nr:MAG TPA: hypothetical protein [Caudoviricetes sp.]
MFYKLIKCWKILGLLYNSIIKIRIFKSNRT